MQHLAIIMDGNRRWAHENALSVGYGHDKGAQTLSEIGREVARLNIPFLTVFAFSSENWRRSKAEVNALFGLNQGPSRFDLQNGFDPLASMEALISMLFLLKKSSS